MQTYEPLFLKYRPQSLSDLLGQSSVKETLINAISNEKIVHAYLLTGPRGSGKTSSARILAKSLNCLEPLDGKSPTTQPCGKCDSCVGIANSSSVDVTEIDAASHGGVDDARKLIEKVNLASVAGKYRIYIIDEVHMLSTAAFNALLKVIEEPPAKVVFIMATTEVDKVPKTISSRCQQLRFKPISPADCVARMRYVSEQENINIDDKALEMIASHSDGAMRDTLSLLDQLSVFSNECQVIGEEKVLEILGAIPKEELANLSKAILERNSKDSFGICNELINKGKDTISICQELSNFILGMLEAINNGELEEKYASVANCISENKIENFELVQILDSLTELEAKLKQSVQSKNLLRAWLIKIACRQDILVVKDLLERVKSLEDVIASGARPSAKAAPMPSPAPQRAPQAMPQTQAMPKPAAMPKPPSSEPETSKAVAMPEVPAASQAQPSPAPAASAPPANPAPSKSFGSSFLDHLSPGSKGMYISSQAQLQGVSNGIATIYMPEKFKFLKSKLEQRKEEIIKAIAQDSGQEVKSLEIEVKTIDSAPQELSPRHTSIEEPKPQANTQEEVKDTTSSSILTDTPNPPQVINEVLEEKTVVETKALEVQEPAKERVALDTVSDSCSVRNDEIDQIDNSILMKGINTTKLDEVADAAATIFGGKIIEKKD